MKYFEKLVLSWSRKGVFRVCMLFINLARWQWKALMALEEGFDDLGLCDDLICIFYQRKQLTNNTANRPHVHSKAVIFFQENDLGSSIPPRCNMTRYLPINLYSFLARLLQFLNQFLFLRCGHRATSNWNEFRFWSEFRR